MSAEAPAPQAQLNQSDAEMGPNDWMDIMAQDEVLAQPEGKELLEIDSAKTERADQHEAKLTEELTKVAGGELDEALASDVRSEAERQAEAEFTPKNLKKAGKAMDKAEQKQERADAKAAQKAEKGPNYIDKLKEIDAAKDQAMKEGFDRVDQAVEKAKISNPDVLAKDPELATAAKYQVQREVQSEFSRESLRSLNPTERFTRIKSGVDAIKKAYVERRQQRLEPTADGRAKLLEKFGVDAETMDSVKAVVEKTDTYDERMDRTVEQKRKYLNDLTRRVALKGFDLSKLSESEEAKDTLNYFRLMVDYVRTDQSAIEAQALADEAEAEKSAAAELDAKLIEMNPQIEAEIEQTSQENQKFSEKARGFIGRLREQFGRKGEVSEAEHDEEGAEVINLDDVRERRRMRAVGAAALVVFSLGVGSLTGKTDGGGAEGVAYAAAPAAAVETVVEPGSLDLGSAVEAPSDEVVASASTPATEAESSAEQTAETYKVQEADAEKGIWGIAQNRLGEGASNQEIADEMVRIIDLNELPDPNVIFPDQELKV